MADNETPEIEYVEVTPEADALGHEGYASPITIDIPTLNLVATEPEPKPAPKKRAGRA